MSHELPILGAGGERREPSRARLVTRGRRLTFATLGYNAIEAAVAMGAGAAAGSVALVGFGADSLIEMTAGAASLWRLGHDADPARRERAELVSRRIIGVCFLLLAAYVLWESASALLTREHPASSPVGVALAALSLVVMPLLASAKRSVGRAIGSRAVTAEAKQTSVCAWLSAVLLLGLAANALAGWWWADPAAGAAMVPLIAWEGVEGVRGRDACGDGCGCE